MSESRGSRYPVPGRSSSSRLRGYALASALALALGASDAVAATYHISPTGNDANAGTSTGAPVRTFVKAFALMAPGDTLVLQDGTYTGALTGYYHTNITSVGGCANCAQAPSGLGPGAPTVIRAQNPGSVFVDGPLFIGRSATKHSFIRLEGLTFRSGGELNNTSFVTVKNCGFRGGFSIGTNDHEQGNSSNLVEDVWIWAAGQRIIASNYRAHGNVWRRVVVRGDGCGTSDCTGDGNPNVGITVYDSHDVSMQNVIVVDRILAPSDEPYADFAVASHTGGLYTFGRAEWLGTLSLKAPDTGYYMEPDLGTTEDNTIRIRNAVAWGSAEDAFNLARAGTNNLLENLTARSLTGDGVRVAPDLTTGTLRNVIVAGAGRFGINSKYQPTHADVFGASLAAYSQTTCVTNCFTTNPLADGTPASLRHLTRIEPGSFLKAKGFGGADIGATILNAYGAEGTRFGDAGYNTLTATPLWPWPNEERLKAEMCGQSGISRGFCAASSLTAYIWGALGNPFPSADLSLTNTDGVTTASAGLALTYTVTASNLGPEAVVGAIVTDTVPVSLAGASWTCAAAGGAACGAAAGVGNISEAVNLPVGGSVVYTLTGTVGPNPVSLRNIASVAVPTGLIDNVPANNSVTDIDLLVCGVEVVLVPDGRATPHSTAPATTSWYLAALRLGGSYSVEVRSLDGTPLTGTLTLFRGDDGCSGASTLSAVDTAQMTPVSGTNAGRRLAFQVTGVDANYRLRFVNASGQALAYTLSVAETTLYTATWSTNGAFNTYYSLQNTSNAALNGTLVFRSTAGAVVGTFPLALPAGRTTPANTSALGVPRNLTGTAHFSYAGPPGAILATAAIANFATVPSYVQPVQFHALRERR